MQCTDRSASRRHRQLQLLLRVSWSVIVHLFVPGGDCIDAEPVLLPPSNLINTRRSAALCWIVTVQPLTVTVTVPVKIVPLQQNRYCPELALKSTEIAGLQSSCRQPLKTVTLKLHEAVVADVSVAVPA